MIGDNAPNMRAVIALLQEKDKYKHTIPLGCISHLLHLLCGDILRCKSVKKK